jgi:hypothetical protein
VEPHKRWAALPPGRERLPFTETTLVKGYAAVPSAKHSDHPLEVQPLGGVTDGKQLWFKPDSADAWVEVSFELPKDQFLGLTAKLVHSWDYGIYRVKLDGKQVAQLDLYEPEVSPTEHKLGMHQLAAGTHTLRFECAGKAAKSAGYLLGFDALTARNPVYGRAPSVDLRTLQKKN